MTAQTGAHPCQPGPAVGPAIGVGGAADLTDLAVPPPRPHHRVEGERCNIRTRHGRAVDCRPVGIPQNSERRAPRLSQPPPASPMARSSVRWDVYPTKLLRMRPWRSITTSVGSASTL